MTISHTRWIAKKAARYAMALGACSVRPLRSPSGAVIRALTYHRFGHSVRDPWCVDPASFEAQMRFLAEHQLAVSLDDAIRFTRFEIPLKNGSVLITLDDGFSSVHTIAAPIMQRYGIPGVAFITTSRVGNADLAAEGEGYLTWQQVRELPSLGLTIGSHAHTHRSLGRMSPEDAWTEGVCSKQLLEQHLGQPISSFAYPFGMRFDENPTTACLLAEAGYTSVFVAQHGVIRPGSVPLRLPRVKVEGGESGWMFPLICAGAMDGWRFVDGTLWHLQRPEKSRSTG